jgi:hypothetical protein
MSSSGTTGVWKPALTRSSETRAVEIGAVERPPGLRLLERGAGFEPSDVLPVIGVAQFPPCGVNAAST